MPDIQTEMQKILHAWEEPEPQPEQPKGLKLFKPTNNVSQETFNSVRDHAGNPRKFYIELLTKHGHKKASVSSLIGQMLRQGHIYKDNFNLLYANGVKYTPIKSASTVANREKKVKTLKVKTSKAVVESKGITSLVASPITDDRVQEIMDTISLPDAKRLHKALNEYFGSV